MTDFEKSLLTGYIIAANGAAKMSTTIIKACGGEETTTFGDEMQSAVVLRIQTYLESFCDDKALIDQVIEQEILPQVTVNNYSNTITAIEALEFRYNKQ